MKKDMKSFLQNKISYETFFEWSILLFVFTLPLWRNVNTVLLWPIVLCWLFVSDWKTKIRILRQNKTSFILIILLHFLFWIGLLFTDNVKDGFRDIERTLGLVIFPLIILSVDNKYFKIKKIISFLGAGLFLGMIICWYYVIEDIFSKTDPLEQAKYFFHWVYNHRRLLSPIDIHPSYFGIMIVFFLSVVIFHKSFEDFRKKRVLFITTLLLFLLFIVETTSRISFVLFIIIALSSMFLEFNIKKIALTVGTILLIILLSFKFEYLSTKFQKGLDSDGNIGFERVQRWEKIVEVFFDSGDYVFGTGSGDVDKIYVEAYKRGMFELALKEKYNAHNQFLEFFISNGVIGISFYLIVLTIFFLKTRNKKICVDFLLIILLFSITESIFGRSRGIFFFSFFFSVLATKFWKSNSSEKILIDLD